MGSVPLEQAPSVPALHSELFIAEQYWVRAKTDGSIRFIGNIDRKATENWAGT